MSPARSVPEPLRAVVGLPDRARNLSGGLGSPEAPSYLAPAARQEWRRVVKACADRPLWLQQTDRRVLELWCTWTAVLEDATTALKADAVLLPGRSSADKARGALVKHPALPILRSATDALRTLGKELGFSPDARAKLPVGTVEANTAEDDAVRLLS